MDFSDMIKEVKAGRKMKREGWVDAYLFYDRCTNCISLKTRAGIKTQFFVSNRDMLATDWSEHSNVQITKMFASVYSAKCTCGKVFVLGADWRTKTGDKIKCSCGVTLLLAPPDEETKVEKEHTQDGNFSWPEA